MNLLKVGQTWKLPSGELVTISTLPDTRGWLRCMSHEVGHERLYGSFAFFQPTAKLVESKTGVETDFRAMVKQLVAEILAEQEDRPRKKRK